MFALVHSPLVGPSTWSLVAAELQQQGYRVVVPDLVDREDDPRPLWEQQAESAAHAINAVEPNEPSVLVGHSGAGPILPAIACRLNLHATGYIFVDAGLPQPHASRLEMMKVDSPQWVQEFEQSLIAGGRFPRWSDADLQSVIPKEGLRRQVLHELNPRGLRFFVERIFIPEDWWRTPGGYVQFTETYAIPARQAKQRGWPLIRFQAEHFHMLVEAIQVTQALLEIAESLSISD